jgi:hypothetical protein
MPAEEKPLQKRESKTNIISRTKAKLSASPKPDVLHKSSAQRNLNIASKNSVKVLPSCVSPDNLVKVSTSTTKGASWESLPSALQTLGSVQFVHKLVLPLSP